MDTLYVLAQLDPGKGKRFFGNRFWGSGDMHLGEPYAVSADSLWFSKKNVAGPGRTQVYIGKETYFDVHWPVQLRPSVRSQISRAIRRDIRFELRRKGQDCPAEDMRGLWLSWQKSKFLLLGYLLKPLPITKVLSQDCAFLWRGERLVGYAALLHNHFSKCDLSECDLSKREPVVLIHAFYRHESCPNGALPFLVKSLIQTYNKPVSFGLSPDIGFLPKGLQLLPRLVYNFGDLSKARQNLSPTREKKIYLNLPCHWGLYRLSVFLMILLLSD